MLQLLALAALFTTSRDTELAAAAAATGKTVAAQLGPRSIPRVGLRHPQLRLAIPPILSPPKAAVCNSR